MPFPFNCLPASETIEAALSGADHLEVCPVREVPLPDGGSTVETCAPEEAGFVTVYIRRRYPDGMMVAEALHDVHGLDGELSRCLAACLAIRPRLTIRVTTTKGG